MAKGNPHIIAPFGLREDGTPKSLGYFGKLNRPDGRVSTELSIGLEIDGKETLVPSLVPTLDEDEIQFLLRMTEKDKIPLSIMKKAKAHAQKRIKEGKSPFKELDPDGY